MFRFYDSYVDTNLFMQMDNLTSVLAGDPRLNFAFSYGSQVDLVTNKVTASNHWNKLDAEIMEAGLKTDVFLRTIGTIHHSNLPSMQRYLKSISESRLPKFAVQLFSIFEDIRLEEIVKKERPGTKKYFEIRKQYLTRYFYQQTEANVTRGYPLDELFTLIYLLIQSDKPEPDFPRTNEEQLAQLDNLKPLLYSIYEARNTEQVISLCENAVFRLDSLYKDMINEYTLFPVGHLESYTKNTLFDELTRVDDLVNDDRDDVNEESEYIDQTFSTWHRENENKNRKQNFLQFELEQGTKTNMIGGEVRETETQDQAAAAVQGVSGESKEKQYTKQEVLNKEETEKEHGESEEFGKENSDAVKRVKEARTPTIEEQKIYEEIAEETKDLQRRLADTIKKTIEHKRSSVRNELLYGRLSKKLTQIVFHQTGRMFYKKNEVSKELDAAFTLLVDCSASMVNKMEETKKGIVLFHEVLKELKIPHAITGFWEDANEVKEDYKPNYFYLIHTYEDSLYDKNGAKIMQLEPEEDNRDGFSIRIAAKDLKTRQEKNKFLLVFTDGEPQAAGYDQNGMVDTHLAVTETRKAGIDVIGLFLSDGKTSERENIIMENIYGRERVIVPSVSELPEQLAPLLKKLLLKAL